MLENLSNQSEVSRLKTAHPEWSFYEPTMRIKSGFLERPIVPSAAIAEIEGAWEVARSIFSSPLVQVRAILSLADEAHLLKEFEDRKGNFKGETRSGVVGRIPFSVEGNTYGIYYLQIESVSRRSYTSERSIAHFDALNLGYERLAKGVKKSPSEEFRFVAVDFSGRNPIDILTGNILNLDPDALSREIVDAHKSAFAYSHDPNQEDPEGVRDILLHNPTIIAFGENGRIASVSLFERDDRFSFGKISLVEPTYFTRPEAEGKGLSSHLRQIVKQLIEGEYAIPVYNNHPVIVFTESIRHSTFPLCLGNGHVLAGSLDSEINGNLGEAYTAIGPANPETGYMAMGLTYLTSPRVKPLE